MRVDAQGRRGHHSWGHGPCSASCYSTSPYRSGDRRSAPRDWAGPGTVLPALSRRCRRVMCVGRCARRSDSSEGRRRLPAPDQAAENAEEQIVRQLLTQGADVEERGPFGNRRSPLVLATKLTGRSAPALYGYSSTTGPRLMARLSGAGLLFFRQLAGARRIPLRFCWNTEPM